MSKMYQLNRMAYAPAAGGMFGDLLKVGGKLLKGIFKKKSVKAVAEVAGKVAKSPVAQGAAGGAAWMATEALLTPGGKGGGGASGGWGRRRARGITALELRGYRKVANLIHREGMVSRRARGRR